MTRSGTTPKPWYMSMTFWGTILLALEAGLQVANQNFPALDPFIIVLGTFLTAFGFRRAIGTKAKITLK